MKVRSKYGKKSPLKSNENWKKVNKQNKIPLFVRQNQAHSQTENKTEKVFSLKGCENGHSEHIMNNWQNSKFCWFSVPHLSLQKDENVLLGNIYIDDPL